MFEGISFTMWEVITWVVITYILGIAVGYGICYVKLSKLRNQFASVLADWIMAGKTEEEQEKIKEQVKKLKDD